jgi:hypothetical protein
MANTTSPLASMRPTKPAPVRTIAAPLLPLLRWQVAAYCDRCRDGFRPVALWRDSWPGPFGAVRTIGADLGPARLRLVIERRPVR